MIEFDVSGVQVEDSRVAGPVTKGFTGLILRAVAAYRQTEGPDQVTANAIMGCIMRRNLDALDPKDLQIVFAAADFYFKCMVVDSPLKD